ncbi:protein of unknown function [Shinella sp. WSC3-e]|nr:protein of unknown function [Shinella sp. WSC3-e]
MTATIGLDGLPATKIFEPSSLLVWPQNTADRVPEAFIMIAQHELRLWMQQYRLVDDFHALFAVWTTINDIAEEYEAWCTTGSFFFYRCEERTKEIISAVDIPDCVRQVHAECCPFLIRLTSTFKSFLRSCAGATMARCRWR